MVPCIYTENSVNFVLNSKPVSVSKADKHYPQIVQALKEGADDAAITEILEKELTRITAATALTDDIVIQGGELLFQGDVINNTLSQRILMMVDEGFVLAPMVNFMTNLMQNPSMYVTEQLYAFLEKGKNAITDDGHFLAYKAVRMDFKDIHSGTFDNSIGQVVAIPRRKVDENPNVTCSYGLHVCSFDYLPHFAHANGHIMICKVNPADVVAIPADYNNTKMRVCRYEVIGEYADYYDRTLQTDVLGETTVLSGTGSVDDYPFVVQARYGAADSTSEIGVYSRLSAASDVAESLLADDTSVYQVLIINRVTGVEVYAEINTDYDGDSTGNSDDEDDTRFEIHTVSADGAVTYVDDFSSLAIAKSEALDIDLVNSIKVQVVEIRNGTETVMLTLS